MHTSYTRRLYTVVLVANVDDIVNINRYQQGQHDPAVLAIRILYDAERKPLLLRCDEQLVGVVDIPPLNHLHHHHLKHHHLVHYQRNKQRHQTTQLYIIKHTHIYVIYTGLYIYCICAPHADTHIFILQKMQIKYLDCIQKKHIYINPIYKNILAM